MVGCRHHAKNTLDKNYLYFAEQLGAEVRPETLVTGLREDGHGGYVLTTRRSTAPFGAFGDFGDRLRGRRAASTLRARGVVLAAGALGTVNLLLAVAPATTRRGSPSPRASIRQPTPTWRWCATLAAPTP